MQAAYPADADPSFLLELIRIDAQKRLAAGHTLDEAFYLQAFPVLQAQPEQLEKLRQITFTPMPVGDSVLRALAVTTPVLQQVNLPDADPQARHSDIHTETKTPSQHRFTIESEIARGGMGAVLRGRDEDLGREIAVKVMLQNHAGKTELLQRFVEEAQIAGQLQHPGITPVYEFGRFPDQRPYFTMKLVRGQTLAKLLKDRPDPNSERPRFLKIFEQICQTLAYAHARKVIHRDLKPHNIMVGSFGEVQVMDWGLAKVLTASAKGVVVQARTADVPESTEGSVQTQRSSGNSTDIPNTQAGSVLGTPAYMAPEQARGDIDQLDERADVFGLGAILCEILTGKPAFVGENGIEIYRKAVDADLADTLTRLQNCQADAELISLAQRCLAANPADRPGNASELTRELSAYLHSVEDRLKQAELTAVKATTKAEEESKRRRVTFRLAAGILLTLLAGLGASLWQMNRAMVAEKAATDERDAKEVQRKEAVTNLAYAKKGNEILGSVFTWLDPEEIAISGRPLQDMLRMNLQQAVKDLEGSAIGDPLAVAQMQTTLGLSLKGLGDYEQPIILFTKALETNKSRLGPDHPTTLGSMSNLASCYRKGGKLDLALPLHEETLKLRSNKLGADHPETLESMNNLAGCYQSAGKLDLAVPLYENTLKLKKEKLGPDHPDTLITMGNLADGYQAVGKPKLAEPLFEETLRLTKIKKGADHPHTMNIKNSLAACYYALGKYESAQPLFKETHQMQHSRLGPDHPYTLTTLNNLALCYKSSNQPELALPLFVEVLKQFKIKQGFDHPDTLISMGNLAGCYHALRKMDKAVPLLEEAYKLSKPKLGADHPFTLGCMGSLATCHFASGKMNQAIPLFELTVELMKVKLGPEHPNTLTNMHNLAECYRRTGKFELALPLFEESLKHLRIKIGQDHPETLMVMNNLAVCYYSMRKKEQALALFDETLKIKKVKLGPDHPDTLSGMGALAGSYHEVGNLELAVALFETAATGIEKMNFQHEHAAAIIPHAAAVFEDAKQYAKAESWRRKWLAVVKQQAGAQSATYFSELASLGLNLLDQQKWTDAEPVLREVLVYRQKAQPEVWTTFNTQSMLGGALLGQKKYSDAEPLLMQGYQGLKQREKSIPRQGATRLPDALNRLILLYTVTNKPDEVKKWQAEKEKLSKPAEKKN